MDTKEGATGLPLELMLRRRGRELLHLVHALLDAVVQLKVVRVVSGQDRGHDDPPRLAELVRVERLEDIGLAPCGACMTGPYGRWALPGAAVATRQRIKAERMLA